MHWSRYDWGIRNIQRKQRLGRCEIVTNHDVRSGVEHCDLTKTQDVEHCETTRNHDIEHGEIVKNHDVQHCEF